jgi:hypothetical protein
LKVDLRNERYYLQNYNRSRGLSITSNGIPRSDRRKDNVIRAKEKVEIKYTKEYHKSIEETGTLSNPSPGISKYLDINGSKIIIKWDKLSSDLKPFEKTLTFNVYDWKKRIVSHAEITCHNNNNEQRAVVNNKITFSGDDLGKRWRVSARNDNFYSDARLIDFDKDCPDTSSSVDINLDKFKLKIVGHEENLNGNEITDAINVDKTEFIGSEIERTHKISVSSRRFESHSFEYCPSRDENPIHIPLQKKHHSYGGITYSHSVHPDNRGKLKVGKKESGYKKRVLFAGIIVGLIAIAVLGAYYFIENDRFEENQSAQNSQLDTKYIQAYILGDSLILDTLKYYKETLGSEQTTIISSLDTAIKKRAFVDNWNLPELKKFFYYPQQEKFKKVIFKIDSPEYKKVEAKLTDVSSWSLAKIADTISALLDRSNLEADRKTLKGKAIKEPEEKQTAPAKPEQAKEREKDLSIKSSNNANDITKELKSGTVTKDELYRWKDAKMDRFKKSIELYEKFWKVCGSREKDDFVNLLKEVERDPILNSSELKNFLVRICKKDVFTEYIDIRGREVYFKTINDLRNKLK